MRLESIDKWGVLIFRALKHPSSCHTGTNLLNNSDSVLGEVLDDPQRKICFHPNTQSEVCVCLWHLMARECVCVFRAKAAPLV